jgi:CDP-4-dehydro-6-deoxyglucose reductase
MPVKWYHGKVIQIEDASSTTKRFWVEVPPEENLTFKAGQFVVMDLPIGEKRLQRWRSYSIANPPKENGKVLEFCIVRLENGAAGTYFFEEVEIGTKIKFKAPDGNFCLPEKIDHDIVMVCTGTGVAPFRSMLWDIHINKIPHQKIHLIFGTRTESSILYRDEFIELQKLLPNFKYDIALSREEVENTFHGYVHQIYLDQYKDLNDQTKFYLCGWSKMIDDAVANLLIKMKARNDQVIYELYG